MVEVTIEITQYCPYECDYCSTNASPEGKHLSYKIIKDFLNNQKNITRINISGGEPLAHPDFYKILMFCYSITNDVRIYTNVIKHILFNSDIIKEIKVDANVCVVPGRKIYIPKNVNKVHLLKLVHHGRAKKLSKQEVIVSHNFGSDCSHKCEECKNILLQADGKIVESPCKKDYEVE
jgi:organic radical activating enzyme